MKGRTLLESAGAAILYLLAYLWTQLAPDHVDLYHRFLPIHTILSAIAIDLVLVSLAAVVLLWLLDRFDREQRSFAWVIFFSAIAAKTVSNLILLTEIPPKPVTPGAVFVGLCALLALLWWRKRAWYRNSITGLRIVLSAVGFCIFWMLPQLVYFASRPEPHDVSGFTRPAPVSHGQHRRIVWVLFDELSYDQLFDHRYPGLAMPNFDQFKTHTVTFSNVTPAGYLTERIIPGLLLGQHVTNIRASMDSKFYVQVDGKWRLFDADATIFADAQRKAWSTGVAGWFNPYCRLLPEQLNSCFWVENPPVFLGHQSPQYSVMKNTLVPFFAFYYKWTKKPIAPVLSAADHVENYKQLEGPAMDLVSNDEIDFAFVHLPVPHPPGLYDRRSQRLVAGGSYIDNLAYTDKVLGEILTRVQGDTTLIISSDHSWRTPMWKGSSVWTKEDQLAYRGFEKRPVLMIRFPDEAEAKDVTQAFPGLQIHGLLEGMLDGSLTSVDSLDTWLARQH